MTQIIPCLPRPGEGHLALIEADLLYCEGPFGIASGFPSHPAGPRKSSPALSCWLSGDDTI